MWLFHPVIDIFVALGAIIVLSLGAMVWLVESQFQRSFYRRRWDWLRSRLNTLGGNRA